MKIKLSREKMLGGRSEWTLEVERTSSAELARFAAEDRERYWMALKAISAAPDSAEAICDEVL